MEEGWRVVAIVHQEHVSHLRTFFHLEQISVWSNLGILDGIKRIKYNNIDGSLCFCFRTLSDASDVVQLISKIVPVRCYVNNISPGERYIFRVEIVPICCGDLIFLHPDVAATFGPNIGPVVICTRVAKTFTLLDPFTLTHCFLKSDQYWNEPFTPFFTTTKLIEYVVLDIFLLEEEEDYNEEEEVQEKKKKKKRIIEDENDDADADAADAAAAKKYRLADALVSPVKDNGTTFRVKTHLGRILKPGDHALGYDLSGAITNTIGNLPDAILITKTTTCDAENGRVLVTHDKWESDYQLFVKDLLQDTKLIFSVRAAYRNPANRHPSDPSIKSPFRRSPVPLEDLLDG